jgi:hypothetical protein
LTLVKELRSAGRPIQVLLSSRPSGKDRVNEAVARRFEQSEVSQFDELNELKSKDAKELANGLLSPSHLGNVDWLRTLAGGNPLIIVIGARLLRKDVPFGKSIQNSNQFRRAIFHKFLDELSGQDKTTRRLLYLIAAVSPIPLPLTSFTERAALTIVPIPPHEIALELTRLEQRGLLAVRSKALRIVPDVVSDFLLEEACVGIAGEPTGFPDAVFEVVKDSLLSNLLQNVGELDWRVQGRHVHEGLLAHIWDRVNRSFNESDPFGRTQILQAVQPASVFQPAPVLNLVTTAMDDRGRSISASRYEYKQSDVLNALPPILRAISLNPDFTKKAAHLLWQLSKYNGRPQNQWPDHAARVLSDLAHYGTHRPVLYNELILDFVVEIASEDDAFEYSFSPLDIVDNLLSREGDHTESAGLTITFSSFELAYENIRHIRERSLLLLEKLLADGDPKASVRSVRSLATVLHSYLPKFGRQLSDHELLWQDDERLHALEILKRHFARVPIPIQSEIYATLRSILAWRHGSKRVISAIEEYFNSIELSDELFVFDAVSTASWDLDRYGEDFSQTTKRRGFQLAKAAEILHRHFPKREACVAHLEAIYEKANSFKVELKGGTELVDELCKDPEFLAGLVEHLLSAHDCISEFAFLMQVVVGRLRSLSPQVYKTIVVRSIVSKKLAVVRGAAAGLHSVDLREGLPEDLEVLRQLSRYSDERVRFNVLNALRFLAQNKSFKAAAIDLALQVDIGRNKQLADDLCEIFGPHSIGPSSLDSKQVNAILEKLLPIPDLDAYNITNLINWALKCQPALGCDFFINRVEFAARSYEGRYQAIPFRTSGISLSGIPGEIDCREQLRRIFSMLLKSSDHNLVGTYELEELFWIFGGANTATLEILDEQIHTANRDSLAVLIDLLGHHAPRRLAFNCPWFVLQLLEAISGVDSDLLERAIQYLTMNALPIGVRSISTNSQLHLDTSAQQKKEQFKGIALLRELFTRIDGAFQSELRNSEEMRQELRDFGQE